MVSLVNSATHEEVLYKFYINHFRKMKKKNCFLIYSMRQTMQKYLRKCPNKDKYLL